MPETASCTSSADDSMMRIPALAASSTSRMPAARTASASVHTLLQAEHHAELLYYFFANLLTPVFTMRTQTTEDRVQLQKVIHLSF
jgi:hypothetical protein